jgi:hypothetical protein
MTETSKCLIEVKSLWTNYSEVVSKFFKSIVKDVRKVVVPEWGPSLKMSLKSKIMGIVLSK